MKSKYIVIGINQRKRKANSLVKLTPPYNVLSKFKLQEYKNKKLN